jgi:hypothetical protein
MSVRSFAFISSMRPMRSFLPLTELSTVVPLFNTPVRGERERARERARARARARARR